MLTASDEWVPGYFNYQKAPLHIMGVRTRERKVASYANWTREGVLSLTGLQAESYDYLTRQGRLELENLHADSGVDQKLLMALLSTFSQNQMAARLPGRYRIASARGRQQYLNYIAFLDATQPDGSIDPSIWVTEIFNPS